MPKNHIYNNELERQNLELLAENERIINCYHAMQKSFSQLAVMNPKEFAHAIEDIADLDRLRKVLKMQTDIIIELKAGLENAKGTQLHLEFIISNYSDIEKVHKEEITNLNKACAKYKRQVKGLRLKAENHDHIIENSRPEEISFFCAEYNIMENIKVCAENWRALDGLNRRNLASVNPLKKCIGCKTGKKNNEMVEKGE